MKLYQLALNKKIRKNDKIYCDISDGSRFIKFQHLDGLYSYNISEEKNVVHLNNNVDLINKNGKWFIKN